MKALSRREFIIDSLLACLDDFSNPVVFISIFLECVFAPISRER